jgi:23S rRNA (adenine2503-C2)-methyltransferase
LHPAARLPQEWAEALQAAGERSFRAEQVFRWIHARGVLDPAAMTDLPKALRERLAAEGLQPVASVAHEHVAADGTTKLLVRMHDAALIETVLIPMGTDGGAGSDDADLASLDDDDEDEEPEAAGTERVTQCISTQVGCAMKCAFCASGVAGLQRQLGAEEILAQPLLGRSLLTERQRLRNLVFMGSGEPLHNYDAVARAIRVLSHPLGIGMSRRRITVSTVGLTEGIARLGRDFEGKVGLAISLHAADDATRAALVPSNKRWPLDSIVRAMHDYPLPGHRRLTVEYALIAGRNDRDDDARKLARLLRGLRVKVNLIPMNRVDHASFAPPTHPRVLTFQRILVEAGYTCLLRKRRGDDISAACGQLGTRNKELGRRI